MGNEEKLNADSTWLINEMNQNWDSFVMFGVNSIDTLKKFFSLCSKMQYGPYDAYMEVPYKM